MLSLTVLMMEFKEVFNLDNSDYLSLLISLAIFLISLKISKNAEKIVKNHSDMTRVLLLEMIRDRYLRTIRNKDGKIVKFNYIEFQYRFEFFDNLEIYIEKSFLKIRVIQTNRTVKNFISINPIYKVEVLESEKRFFIGEILYCFEIGDNLYISKSCEGDKKNAIKFEFPIPIDDEVSSQNFYKTLKSGFEN